MKVKSAKALCLTAVAAFVGFYAATAHSQDQNAAGGNEQRSAPAPNGQPSMGGPGGMMGPTGRGRGPNISMNVNFDDHTGFTQIFDGNTLNGWDGAPEIWHAENGTIVGQSTAEKPSGTTFLIYRGSQPADFDLKFEMKLEGDSGNSGIQYRSRNALPSANFMAGRGPGRPGGAGPGAGNGPGGSAGQGGPTSQANAGGPGGEAGPGAPGGPNGRAPGRGRGMFTTAYQKWNLQGYQDDQNTNGSGSGNLWEGGRFPGERGTVTNVGQIMELEDGQPNVLIGTVGTREEVLSWWKTGDWNQEEIVARGNVLTHLINGHIITETIDDNAAKRTLDSGLIGFQIESGGDYKVSVRNIWLKTIK